MLVTTQRDEHDQTGLHIGAENVRRHFRKGTQAIDLMLDDLRIQCALSPDFWRARPEIHDHRLSKWLEYKADRGRSRRGPMELTMLRYGIDTYVIRPKLEKRQAAFGEEVTADETMESQVGLLTHSLPVLQDEVIA